MGGIRGREVFGANDIVILVAGASGSGKSTFINYLFNKQVMNVGHSLASSSTHIECSVIEKISWRADQDPANIHRLIIVEIPGHDNTFVSDKRILRDTAKWLQSSCKYAIFGGVIYLNDISMGRSYFPHPIELFILREAFNQLPEAYSRLMLVTTSWGKYQEVKEVRELELQKTSWKTLIANGSQVKRFEDSQQSARRILDTVLDRVYSDPRLNIAFGLAQILNPLERKKNTFTVLDGKLLRLISFCLCRPVIKV